jgi:hypothetical protein
MNKFTEELWMFFEKLSNKENFALSRFGDGELTVINAEDFDMIGVGKEDEFSYFNNDNKYEASRNLLDKSFTSNMVGYYKGIPCQCCILGERAKEIFHQIKNKDNLTWANIFVNGNYADFNNYLPSILEDRSVIMVSHKKTNVKSLPFKVIEHITIDSNAWIDSLEKLQNIKDVIEVYELSDVVVLIAGGPFANIAIHELWTWNQNNTYLDVGSTLDPYLFGKPTRQYHANNNPMHQKQCIWFDAD